MSNECLDEYLQDTKEQLNLLSEEVCKADYYNRALKNMKKIMTKKSLLSDEEEKIFSKLLGCIDTSKYILWSQVSFSAFLHNEEKTDWYHYNKFYVDFLVIDKDSKKPHLVIEYYGAKQHNGGKVRARDNFRKAICNKAGLGFVELKKMEEIEQLKRYKDYRDYIVESLDNFREILNDKVG